MKENIKYDWNLLDRDEQQWQETCNAQILGIAATPTNNFFQKYSNKCELCQRPVQNVVVCMKCFK